MFSPTTTDQKTNRHLTSPLFSSGKIFCLTFFGGQLKEIYKYNANKWEFTIKIKQNSKFQQEIKLSKEVWKKLPRYGQYRGDANG